MNGAQKTIKGLAVALAIVIMVSVLSACVGAGMILSRVFSPNNAVVMEGDQITVGEEWEVSKLDELKIELGAMSLRIERGDKFQVVANEEKIEVRKNGDRVEIEEKDFGWLQWWDKVGGEVKVVLPEDVEIQKMTLDMGAGAVYAENLVAEELDLDLGAGRAEFDGLKVTRRAKIDGGAGVLIVRGAEMGKLDLDMGVGKVGIETSLSEDSKVSAGVGKLELTLVGEEDDYQVKFDQGLGSLSQDGISLDNPNGRNLVEIDGGVEAIELRLRSRAD